MHQRGPRKKAPGNATPFACVYCSICVDSCPKHCLSHQTNYRKPSENRQFISLQGTPPVSQEKGQTRTRSRKQPSQKHNLKHRLNPKPSLKRKSTPKTIAPRQSTAVAAPGPKEVAVKKPSEVAVPDPKEVAVPGEKQVATTAPKSVSKEVTEARTTAAETAEAAAPKPEPEASKAEPEPEKSRDKSCGSCRSIRSGSRA